jgi:maleylacetate reductase
MTSPFVYQSAPSRILFGAGTVTQLADEVQKLRCKRVLVLSTPFQKGDAAQLESKLGALAAGVFSDATMHTPVDVTDRALAAFEAAGADGIVSIGGGSTIGLGKAMSWRNKAPHLVVATTYAGSEVTDILGQTENGVKTTIRDPAIRPEAVIYDANLTLDLPVSMSVSSGLNAMAHAIEGLYARDRNPMTSLMAVEAIRALKTALPRITNAPDDADARSDALYGSWLCGVVLGSVGMSLHHKLCHTLGGTLNLPHAETHAILLPHTAAFNAVTAHKELGPATSLFGGDLGGGLFDFAKSLGAPLALRDLGVSTEDLEKVADMAVKNPYWNPREITRSSVLNLLSNAHNGTRPHAI